MGPYPGANTSTIVGLLVSRLAHVASALVDPLNQKDMYYIYSLTDQRPVSSKETSIWLNGNLDACPAEHCCLLNVRAVSDFRGSFARAKQFSPRGIAHSLMI